MNNLLPFALLGMGLLIFGWIIFRLMLKRRAKNRKRLSPQKQVQAAREEADRLAPRGERALRDAPADVLRWQVEMQEMARDLKGELDTRISLLSATVRLADQRIGEMKKLLEQMEARSESHQDE